MAYTKNDEGRLHLLIVVWNKYELDTVCYEESMMII